MSIRIHNASYVDVTWALGIAATAVTYALLADGSATQRVLVAGLGAIWGVRLGTYLLARLAGKEEDGRYQELPPTLGTEREPCLLRLLPGTGGVHSRLLASVRTRCRRSRRDDLARLGRRRARAGLDCRRTDGRHSARCLEGRHCQPGQDRRESASGAGPRQPELLFRMAALDGMGRDRVLIAVRMGGDLRARAPASFCCSR